MKSKYFALLILLGAGLLALPNMTKASGDINLKEVFLASPVNTTDSTFTVKASVTELLVSYNTSTKVSGGPKDISYQDWQLTDKLAITGQIIGYENGKLKIQAQTIKYDFSKRLLKKTTAYVNNIDVTNHKIWLTIKDRNNYSIQEISKVGEPDGPQLIGFSGLADVTLGSAVSLNQIWDKAGKTLVKTVSITKLTKSVNLQVISLIRSGTTFSLEAGTPTTLSLKHGQKFLIQNKTGVNLYFSTSGESGKFSPKPSNGFILLKNGNSVQYTINQSALVGPVSLPFKTDLLETATPVITVQLEITD